MLSYKQFSELLPFVKNHKRQKAEFLYRLGQFVERERGFVLTKQYERSHSFYLLLNGTVNFSISVDSDKEELSVGKSSKTCTPAGWSGFREPYRYATTITCDEKCVFIQWSHRHLESFFEQEPELGCDFMMFVLRNSMVLLQQVRTSLANYGKGRDLYLPGLNNTADAEEDLSVAGPLYTLKQSPFFEVFSESLIYRLASVSQKKSFPKGKILFRQSEVSEGIYLLAHGKIALGFAPALSEDDMNENAQTDTTVVRHVDRSGYIVGLSVPGTGIKHGVSAVAVRDSVAYMISRSCLESVLRSDPSVFLEFTKRLLWLVGNILRDARTRYISHQYEQEVLAISNLIEQNATQLSVKSPLHKLPCLLENVITLGDGFELLFSLEGKGTSLEKSLSRLCLDISGKIYREYLFFEGLKEVYDTVVNADSSLVSNEIRKLSSEKFAEVFELVPYVIKGMENLPDRSGNIVIFNHLLNHPYNTLPNNFQLTLDSHFVSSMILLPKYGDPGVRVVRVPMRQEYAHQNYYSRLGYINVYTPESEARKETNIQRKTRIASFYKTAGEYLKQGSNLVLNPEGTSLETEESPGPFRHGAFSLAASCDPEPFIIPIVVANFDKRVNRNVFAVIIKEPFRITEVVKDPADRDKMSAFLVQYRELYRTYVEEAVVLAETEGARRLKSGSFESVNEIMEGNRKGRNSYD